ncbi:transglutaminase TgpA family protein [Halorientalis pallida]|uniref:transglutaminase TgpA family protein n=1 Tax=Halorientalis pallida TaxID=2479928 RepID=UPI003C6EE5FA
MSAETGGPAERAVDAARRPWAALFEPRGLALLSAGLMLFSFTFPLYGIIDVVGDPSTFLLVVAVTLVLATGLSRVVGAWTALPVGLGLLVLGLWMYASALPADVVAQQDRILGDVVSLFMGLSVLRLQMIELFALAYTPAPVFLTWYLALRRRYVGAALVGGAALTFFVLTGDVDTLVALLGALGAVGTVGFGRLERFGGADRAVETMAVVLAAMVVVTMLVSVVPGGTGTPFGLFGTSGTETIEGSLINSDQRVSIQGSISLSEEVRFTVESPREAYWRTGAYDRYTGDGWVRTGSTLDYRGEMSGPRGESRIVEQEVTIESELDAMPAAWKPVSVSENVAGDTSVTSLGGLQPAAAFAPGDSYTVVSRQPVVWPGRLQRAGDDYPGRIESRYTNLPASTPDRVATRTRQIQDGAGADTAYETARAVESYLEREKGYSLAVDRPDGEVADSFLFEMDEGYCTYFATTMVTMLRTQDIPARFVVGYTTGEQVDSGTYQVRGLDSHAWVEVYFPDVGWVQFDPTPAGPRQDAEQERIEGGGGDLGNVDDDPEPTTEPPSTPDRTTRNPTPETPGSTVETIRTPTTGGDAVRTANDESGGIPLPEPPSREEAALILVVLAGAAAGARRLGLHERAYRAVWVRWQPRADPASDVQRAFERVEYVLAREERPRRDGETPRQYLAAIDADETVERVYRLHERARYAGEVTGSVADDAVAAADEIVRERTGPLS